MLEEKKIFLLLLFVRFLGLCLSSEAERRLLDDLLGEYQKFERPGINVAIAYTVYAYTKVITITE
jgi:hypothetical protein